MRQSTDKTWILSNLEDTIALGEALFQRMPNLTLLLLQGPLGAGKTSLVKGLANSLGISDPITSPSFSLAQHYPQGNPPLIHIDLYRLEDQQAADELFLQEEEEAEGIGAIMAIEWPERLGLSLPEAWRLKLQHLNSGERLAELFYPSQEERNSSTSS